ncbi:DUF192 domain-containing protein [Bartonella sp. CB178]|uniref:DUF192 domain-containing protein n=1 Tax=Bartonella sp. CB178 TaxID=3112255 RepID=UPI00300DEA85
MLKLSKKGKIVRLVLFFMLLCGVSTTEGPLSVLVHSVPLVIKTAQDEISYQVELAFTADKAEAGLMYRTDFPRDRAMLFKNQGSGHFGSEGEIFMWMANTPLSLDMIFLNAEGIIVSIVEKTVPFSTDIISSKVPAVFAIEVNAGEVSEKQIKKGRRVIHPAICGKCEGNKNDS